MLFVIATPICNRGDKTLRAVDVLRAVDLVSAEDTRHSGMLLQHLGIAKPFVSYHQHNEARRTAELITRLEAGEKIALLTDAGLPGISDPGHRLIRACLERNLPYTILPGASSVLTALVGSGFGADKFYFGGFLPVKSGGRERDLRAALAREETSIFFESPHRLLKTLAVCAQHAEAERRLCVARELTKQFEEFRIGHAAELLAHYSAHPPKGEIVFLISGKAK
jgi:16S rRNA (cytidine1402-2'-O)-methyltransferase